MPLEAGIGRHQPSTLFGSNKISQTNRQYGQMVSRTSASVLFWKAGVEGQKKVDFRSG